MHNSSFALLAALALSPSVASAQFGDAWLTLGDETATRLPSGALSISDPNHEVDADWGDLDNDGFVDLVVVRKEPFTTTGRRTNLLLMNEGGVLVDRTAQLATAADVPGDMGFLTETNDRDVEIADVNNDGWLDVITAVALSEGQPKTIGHPRIYINLGADASGSWLGLRYEDARFPRLYSYFTGIAQNPMFCSVSAGDVTGDGYVDLYFCDYDSVGVSGTPQEKFKDLNDRLLINDGNGYFTDESQLRMTPEMLESAFGVAAEIADFNGDGWADVLKDTALTAPSHVAISYNDPSAPGTFNLFDPFHFEAPYHVSAGDLNGDGKLDVVVSDDNADKLRINTGNDPFGRVEWSAAQPFDFLVGGDDTLASNSVIVDLDGDGLNEVLVCDVDVHTPGYTRRLHVYHNRTATPGATSVLLREEREDATDQGWIGAVGLHADDLEATHDVAAFDLENDGDVDLVLLRASGASVWINGSGGPACGVTAYGTGLGGANVLTLEATGSVQSGTSVWLTTTGIGTAVAVYALSSTQTQLAYGGGTVLVELGSLILPLTSVQATSGAATWMLAVPSDPGLVGAQGFVQAAVMDITQPGGWSMSNGLQLVVCP